MKYHIQNYEITYVSLSSLIRSSAYATNMKMSEVCMLFSDIIVMIVVINTIRKFTYTFPFPFQEDGYLSKSNIKIHFF